MKNKILFMPFIALYTGLFFSLPASASLIGDEVDGALHIKGHGDKNFLSPTSAVVGDGAEFWSINERGPTVHVDLDSESIWLTILPPKHLEPVVSSSCRDCPPPRPSFAIWLTDLDWGDTPGYIVDIIPGQDFTPFKYEIGKDGDSVHFLFNPYDIMHGDEISLDSSGIPHKLSFHFDLIVKHVPIPAALPLFLSSLAGLGFLGSRRRKQEKINHLATA